MKRVIIIAALVGLVVLLCKQRAVRRQEWHGMTEEQVRERLGEKLPSKMPDEAKAVVTNKIVDKMRDKGAIIDLTDDAETADSETAEEATTV